MEHKGYSVNEILEVHRLHSNVSAYYGLLSPLQITLEDCTGTGERKGTRWK